MSEGTPYPGASFAEWLEGARPHTWANAIAPVIAGTAAAQISAHNLSATWFRAILAGIVALALIVGVNYANDYSDGIRGTDDDRSGPLRLTGSGLVEPRKVKRAAFLSFGVAAVAGAVLSLISAPWLILVGVLCILGAWFYTGGTHPYGYRGLGEVAVFIFFGVVAVHGTEFTQTGSVTWRGGAMAVVVGALSSSVNLVNNLRDIPTDRTAGKITLAVRLGDRNTRVLWLTLIAVSIIMTAVMAWGHWPALFGLLAVPLWGIAARPITENKHGGELIPVLGLVGRGMLLWSVAMLLGAFL